MKTAHAETVINAPVDKVWAVMMDLERYPEWNPFTVKMETPQGNKPGAPILLHVRWGDGGGVKSPEKIMRVDPPARGGDGRVRGVYGYNFGTILSTLNLVRSKREQTIEALPDGTTKYVSHIELTGLLSGLTPLPKVQDGFDRQAAALKKRCESLPR